MQVIEIRIVDASTLPEAMAGMRQWRDHRCFQPAVFRSTFTEAGLVLRIEFATAPQAKEFAQAFDGTIDDAPVSSPIQTDRVWPLPTAAPLPDAGRIDTTLVAELE